MNWLNVLTESMYTGEVSIPCGGWCNGADFTEISKFPEILSMRKPCVPGSFLSAHALEPGNEARIYPNFVPAQPILHTRSEGTLGIRFFHSGSCGHVQTITPIALRYGSARK